MYILKLKEQLLKIQKLHIKQTSNLHNLHTHTHSALTFERISLFRNAILFSLYYISVREISKEGYALGSKSHPHLAISPTPLSSKPRLFPDIVTSFQSDHHVVLLTVGMHDGVNLIQHSNDLTSFT